MKAEKRMGYSLLEGHEFLIAVSFFSKVVLKGLP